MTTWNARPEGALNRWCVVEGERVIAFDLSEEEARRIAASPRTEAALEELLNAYLEDERVPGDACRRAIDALLASKGVVA